MKNVEIVQYKQRLDNLFDQIALLTDKFELQSHWARYLCVLLAGFIETSVQSIYIQYSKDKAAPNVTNYVTSRVKRFANPNMEDILELAGHFDKKWRDCISNNADSELKDAVDSVMAQRNLIAHGVNTGISYVRVKNYYKNIVKLVELVENTCN